MTKATATITVRIKALIGAGVEPVKALRMVVGDAAVDGMISDLYDKLREKAAAATPLYPVRRSDGRVVMVSVPPSDNY